MGRKIVVTSGKGGVGKTTITANLAYRLAACGERVVAVDGDLGLNNLDVAMGVEEKVSYDIFDCLDNKCRAKQALVQSPWHKNLYLLPARFGANRSAAVLKQLRTMIDELAASFDYLLLDCPAGIDEGFRRAVSLAEEALVVITPHISSIRDADKVVGIIGETQPIGCRLVINKLRGDLVASGDMPTPNDIAELIKIPIAGVIPEDDAITIGRGVDGARSAKAFKILADNVRRGRSKIYDCSLCYTGFLGSIRRKIKRIL